MDKKDESFIGGGDAYNLAPGSSSRMFQNEKLADSNRRKREMEARQASKPKGVRGIVDDLQGLLNAAQLENDSFSSYMRTMASKGHEAKPEDMVAEFRARELNLALIARIQRCLDKYRIPKPN